MKFFRPLLMICFLVWPMASVMSQTFEDVTESSGLQMTHEADKMSTGVAVADFDNNGWPDLFLTGYFDDSKLYFNNGDGTFEERDNFIMPDLSGANCGSVAAADFDNDGWQDIYVACYGDNYLLRNIHGASFQNVIEGSGSNHATRTEAVSWGDLNNDGWLDLVVAAHPPTNPPDLTDPNNLDLILINNTNGTFTNISSQLDIEDITKYTLALMLLDYDFDNDLDIYFANDRHVGNVLLRNDGPGCNSICLTDVSDATGASYTAYSMGVAASDFDNDGDWDLSYSSIDEHLFLRNDGTEGSSNYVEVGNQIGASFPAGVGWGTIFFDADNDAWEDMFVAINSSSDPSRGNLFLKNQGDGTFADLSNSSNLDDLKPSQAVAWMDYNKDGKLDLVYGNFNIDYSLQKNTSSNSNHWIAFELEGGLNVNRDAIGAKVYVTNSLEQTQVKELRSGESRGSSNQMLLHFGTGSDTSVEVSVHWPDGTVQDMGSMQTDQYHYVLFPPADPIFEGHFDSSE